MTLQISKFLNNAVEAARVILISILYLAGNILFLTGAAYTYTVVFPDFNPAYESEIMETGNSIFMLVIALTMFGAGPIISGYHCIKDGYRYNENGAVFTEILCITLITVCLSIVTLIISLTAVPLFGIVIDHIWLNLLYLGLMLIASLVIAKAHEKGRKEFKP